MSCTQKELDGLSHSGAMFGLCDPGPAAASFEGLRPAGPSNPMAWQQSEALNLFPTSMGELLIQTMPPNSKPNQTYFGTIDAWQAWDSFNPTSTAVDQPTYPLVETESASMNLPQAWDLFTPPITLNQPTYPFVETQVSGLNKTLTDSETEKTWQPDSETSPSPRKGRKQKLISQSSSPQNGQRLNRSSTQNAMPTKRPHRSLAQRREANKRAAREYRQRGMELIKEGWEALPNDVKKSGPNLGKDLSRMPMLTIIVEYLKKSQYR